MTQPDWSTRLVSVIADQIKHFRQQRGLSAQQLAKECKDLGYPVPRSVIANLESGRRAAITLPELLVLAKALEVSPVLLVFPLGQADTVEVLPDRNVDTGRALKWFTGESMFTGETYVDHDSGEVGYKVEPEDQDAWNKRGLVVNLFREHGQKLVEWNSANMNAKAHRRKALKADSDTEREDLLGLADLHQDKADAIAGQIRALRKQIHGFGLKPPELGHPVTGRFEGIKSLYADFES